MPKIKLTSLLDVVELKLKKPLTREVVWMLLRLLDDDERHIFTDVEIKAIESSDHDYVECDREAATPAIPCLMNEPVELEHGKKKIIAVTALTLDGTYILFESLMFGGKTYHHFEELLSRTERRPFELHVDSVMLDQGSVDFLIKKFNESPVSSIKSKKSANIQDQRESGMIAYFKARNFDTCRNDTLQQMYERIGKPVKDELWSQLQRVDSTLFANGQDDFFKRDIFKGDGTERSAKKGQLTLMHKQSGRPPNQ